MPTIEEITTWLASQGMDVPSAMVAAWLEIVSAIEPCFTEAGYAPATQRLIVLYLIALYGLSAGTRYASSQSAPSGASRSFRYNALQESWRGQLAMLRLLDPHNCTGALIPARPGKRSIAIGVATGDCKH